MASGKLPKAPAPRFTTVEWRPSGNLSGLWITPEPPSANELKAWLYHTKAKYRYVAYKKMLIARIRLARSPRLWVKLRLRHTWWLVRQRDEDGLGFSLKPVLDALVVTGVLLGDDPAHLELVYGGQTAGGVGATTKRGLLLTFEAIG